MISRGGFGKVYLGYKANDPDKLYAIKVKSSIAPLFVSIFIFGFLFFSGRTENVEIGNGEQEHGIASGDRAKCAGTIS